MRRTRAAFLGVGKNLSVEQVKAAISQIGLLSCHFKDYYIVLVIDTPSYMVESVLRDWINADSIRRVWKETEKFMFKQWINNNKKSLPREGYIVGARNTALGVLTSSKFDADYVVSIDLDILGLDIGGVKDSFGQTDHWDAVCSHGIVLHGIFRDVYAFRQPEINTNHHLSGLDYADFNVTAAEKMKNRKELPSKFSYF